MENRQSIKVLRLAVLAITFVTIESAVAHQTRTTIVPDRIELSDYTGLTPEQVSKRLSDSPREAQEFYDGIATIPDNGIFDQKLALLEQAALQGDSHSQFLIGIAYYTGRLSATRQRDLCRAAFQFYLAAQQAHRGAQAALGHLYLLGSGVSRNDSEGKRLLLSAFRFDERPLRATPAMNYFHSSDLLLAFRNVNDNLRAVAPNLENCS